MKRSFSILLVSVGAALAVSFTYTVSRSSGTSRALQTEPAVGLNLGNKAPEISMKNTEGQIITLSSLKGKLVLIDFWASWCSPCRLENPSVVQAYTSYKDKNFKSGKGFTVFSVSLDVREDAWKNAIVKDGLSWPSHGCEFMGWKSEVAAHYGVTSIPANYLINEQGIIINKNLRGEYLLNALEKLAVK